MIEAEVIVVGAGPAGCACAWKLNQNGLQTVLLDKKKFPRQKLCAGWITPGVLKNLQVKSGQYPHGLLTFNHIFFHVWGRKLRVPTFQYAIRRIEFDHWLLKKASVPLYLHPVQQAFVEAGAVQCGFCTPGMILTAVDLLHRSPRRSRDEIIAALDRNLCRCGAHKRIIDAVQTAARTMR